MRYLIWILFIGGFANAQEYGYVRFNAEETWVVELNDTLVTSDDLVRLAAGVYSVIARPQISYSWPAIQIEDTITVAIADTTIYTLAKDQSTATADPVTAGLPRTTSYKETDYRPQSHQYPKLKTGLLLTAIAANWLSFYLKRQADNNYSKYSRAASISDIDKYYDLAGNFDDASTVMLSISAAALTGYIYIALIE